jgi:hypothetical protein
MSGATENLARMMAAMPTIRSGRLSFSDRCAAFYALHIGYPKDLAAKVFGMSPGTMYMLANCLRGERNGVAHYQEIAREFRRMGEENFGERYYTPEIDERLQRYRVNAEKISDARRGRGPNPAADHHEGKWKMNALDGTPVNVEIKWTETGWAVQAVESPEPDRVLTPPERFKSSTKALAWARDVYPAGKLDGPLT